MPPPSSYFSMENIQQEVTPKKTWFHKLICAITTIKAVFPNLLNTWTERIIKWTMEINYFNIYNRCLPALCYCLAAISHLGNVLILYGAILWTILTLWPSIFSTSTNILRRENDWTSENWIKRRLEKNYVWQYNNLYFCSLPNSFRFIISRRMYWTRQGVFYGTGWMVR
jgi:hypothetical protein